MFDSRRSFLTQAGRAGGYAAAFALMQALGLMPGATRETVPEWAGETGKGYRVAILGGGIAGLTAAFELEKAGFQCKLLEARERPGGRNWTLRQSDQVEFTDGTRQTANWNASSYFNAGPARIPSIHRNILKYCRELGVELEVEIGSSRSALLVSANAFEGKAVEQRQAINDTRGHVSELLAKCINQSALDADLTKEDREKMLEFLQTYGDLSKEYKYAGSERSGLAQWPGAGDVTAEPREALDMRSLLDANFWRGMMFEEEFDYQSTMLQPVGGMDRIAWAFAKRLGKTIEYSAPVTEIRKTETGVRIGYQQAGKWKAFEADYCVCAMPTTILSTVESNFSGRIRKAVQETVYSNPYKIAWESKRFWETEYNIYGGTSWLSNGPIPQVWYPSARLLGDTGVLVSGYGQEGDSEFGRLPNMDAKIAASRAAVERLHPGHGKDLIHPIYVNWGKIPWNLGGWIGGSYYDGPYREFMEPDDRIHFVGDHVSHINAWQEGAIVSAHRAIQMICDRARIDKIAGRKPTLHGV